MSLMNFRSASSDGATIIWLSRGPSLFMDGQQIWEADLTGLDVPSREEVALLFDQAVEQDPAKVRALPFGQTLRRSFLRMLEQSVRNANLDDRSEFADLLDLILGLGVSSRDLAVALDVSPELVSRYRSAKTAPTKSVHRRAVLVEAIVLARAAIETKAQAKAAREALADQGGPEAKSETA